MSTRKRNYKGADWYLLEHSQTLLDQFTGDKADFEAHDPGFADPFAEDWQEAIDAAVNYQDDTSAQADIAIQTVSVKEQMQLCRNKYDEVIYFAQRAFGKQAIELKAFGKGSKYIAASRSQGKMHNFMDELHQAAEKHKVKLIAAGLTQTKIDEIATLRDSFNTANRTQNTLRTDRPEISQGRLNTYNTLYNSFTTLSIAAAQLVYKNNPAKLEQYTYSPPVNHRPAHRLKIPVPAGATRELTATGIQPPLPENLQPLPHEKVRFSASGSSFTVYVTETPNGSLTEKQLQVAKGKIVSKTIQDILKLLKPGNEEKQLYAYIQNTGTAKGTLTITYYPEQE